jgi:hypothetical protein
VAPPPGPPTSGASPPTTVITPDTPVVSVVPESQ